MHFSKIAKDHGTANLLVARGVDNFLEVGGGGAERCMKNFFQSLTHYGLSAT